MPSWQSYGLTLLLRLQVKRKLSAAKTINDVRTAFKTALPAPPGAIFTADTLGGVPGEWAQAEGHVAATLLYLHGGGYVACSPKTHRPITGAFAIRHFKVFTPDYRLAPEHPFPAALDDAMAVYRALLATGLAPRNLIIGGDSAGGGLALALLLMIKSAKLPMPACAITFSPWTDLAITGATVRSNQSRDAMLPGTMLADGAAFYLNGAAARNPLASPLYGDLGGLPPLLIHVGEPEVLRDDASRFATRAQIAGSKTELHIWPGMPHGWQLFQKFLPEARRSLDQAAQFAKTKLAQSRARS